MASLNLDVGSAANANDGATLRDAFINVKCCTKRLFFEPPERRSGVGGRGSAVFINFYFFAMKYDTNL